MAIENADFGKENIFNNYLLENNDGLAEMQGKYCRKGGKAAFEIKYAEERRMQRFRK